MSASPSSTWPGGCRGALSLTYDDALDCHLDTVAPAIEAAGFRATFYTPINASGFLGRPDDWRALAARGHELGNHTIFHPCRRDKPGEATWLEEGYNLSRYTPTRWRHEMRVANFVLKLLDGRDRRSFGNTCCNTELGPKEGPESLDPLIEEQFVAGRGPYSRKVIDPAAPKLPALGHFGADGRTFEAVRDEIEEAIGRRGWIIYMLHGVGEGTHHLFMDAGEHARLIEWLGQQRDRLWLTPVVEVAERLRAGG